jgi:hypothetical protein
MGENTLSYQSRSGRLLIKSSKGERRLEFVVCEAMTHDEMLADQACLRT